MLITELIVYICKNSNMVKNNKFLDLMYLLN